MVEPAIAFRVEPHERPVLEVRVNFGLYAGRNATAAEIDDLAHALRDEASRFAIVAEARHEFGDAREAALHQVVVEVGDQLPADACERVVAIAERWATACVASRSELGELRDA